MPRYKGNPQGRRMRQLDKDLTEQLARGVPVGTVAASKMEPHKSKTKIVKSRKKAQ